jgi:hypothetical protein
MEIALGICMTKFIFIFLLTFASFVWAGAASPDKQIRDGDRYNVWFPQKQKLAVGYTYKKCEDSTRHRHLIENTPDGGVLSKDCVPDTLYSWGDLAKLNWFKQNLSGDQWTGRLPRELFTTQSPSGSFGYGPIAARFKIKPHVKYVVRRMDTNRPCSSASDEEANNTVYVISWEWYSNNGLDYVICSTNVIESWSYDTKEHYDEVASDATWVLSHKPNEYSLYASTPAGWWYWNQAAITSENNYSFEQQNFDHFLAGWIRAMAGGDGNIYYNKGVPKDRGRHFRTSHPIYYNPN